MPGKDIRALLFDVFGTVVDWRSSIIHELEAVGAHFGIDADWVAFADAWRGLYQPSMEQVRSGQRPWCKLDDLHHESLLTLLERFGVNGLTEAQVDDLNRAWHRLDPWPDTVAGLTRCWSTWPGMPACRGMPCSVPRPRAATSHFRRATCAPPITLACGPSSA